MEKQVAVVEEQFIKIDIWCRPLARTRYSFGDMRKVVLKPRSDGTTTLLASMREKERRQDDAARELREKSDRVHAEYTNALSEFSNAYAGFSKIEIADAITAEEESEALEQAAEKPKRLKRIRSKVAAALFDYSELEQEKIEEEINALVNADGYYDEVEPVDANEDYEEENQVNTAVILLIGVLVVFLAVSGLYFHFFF